MGPIKLNAFRYQNQAKEMRKFLCIACGAIKLTWSASLNHIESRSTVNDGTDLNAAQLFLSPIFSEENVFSSVE